MIYFTLLSAVFMDILHNSWASNNQHYIKPVTVFLSMDLLQVWSRAFSVSWSRHDSSTVSLLRSVYRCQLLDLIWLERK